MPNLTRQRASVLCLQDDKLLTLEMEDPLTRKRYWSFPGGEVEPGESPEECAVRETREESGYEIKLISDVFKNDYLFRWNGKTFDCTTHWYRAELVSPDPEIVEDAAYILRAEWLGWPKCKPLFLFNAGMEEAVNKLLPQRVP